jgi:hypothetical protein
LCSFGELQEILAISSQLRRAALTSRRGFCQTRHRQTESKSEGEHFPARFFSLLPDPRNPRINVAGKKKNTAVGSQALSVNTTRNFNTATGSGALYHNNGDNNTASGAGALENNTTGVSNTAVGYIALISNRPAMTTRPTGPLRSIATPLATTTQPTVLKPWG